LTMAEVLCTRGCSAIEAENGHGALSIWNKGSKIVLVISDVVVPEGGGREFLRSARELKSGLAFLFSSGCTDEPPENLLGSLDGAAVIAKPITIGQFSGTVRGGLGEMGK